MLTQTRLQMTPRAMWSNKVIGPPIETLGAYRLLPIPLESVSLRVNPRPSVAKGFPSSSEAPANA